MEALPGLRERGFISVLEPVFHFPHLGEEKGQKGYPRSQNPYQDEENPCPHPPFPKGRFEDPVRQRAPQEHSQGLVGPVENGHEEALEKRGQGPEPPGSDWPGQAQDHP